MKVEREAGTGLVIVGDVKDVETYMEMRGVHQGIDPATGRRVVYGGKKRMNMAAVGKQSFGFGDTWETNPYIRYGDEFRMARGVIKSVGTPNAKGFDPESKMEITGIANANIIDRVDERLEPAGLDTGNYIKNNILLVDHMYFSDYSVGLVSALEPRDEGVYFDAFVGDPKAAPLTDRQRDIRSLVAQKILKTVSVGFIPHKIKAPEFDDQGALLNPAVVLNWEMLELSIVAVPAHPGATFQQRGVANEQRKKIYASGVALNDSDSESLTTKGATTNNKNNQIGNVKQDDDGTQIQTLIFDKEKFTLDDAVEWAKAHEYTADKVDETETSYRLRQRDPDDFIDDSFRTIEIDDGIQAVIGRLKEGEDEMDNEKAQELIDGIKSLVTLNQSMNDTLKRNVDLSETILGKLDLKKGEDKPPKDDEDDDEKGDDMPKDDEDKKSLEDRVSALENGVDEIKSQVGKIDEVLGKIYEGMNNDG